MDLTATFKADFQDFHSAVAKAKASLETLEKETDQVTKSFSKMGGTMGTEIPKNLKNIATATESIKAPTESWGSALLNVGNIVKGVMGLQIVQWFKDATLAATQWANDLVRMSAKTAIEIQDLQVLQEVARKTGTSFETLGKASQILSRQIGEGKIDHAFRDIGVSVDELRAMKPADQLTAIFEALAKIDDPAQQAAAGALIFKNTWSEITPSVKSNVGEIAKSTKKLSDDQVGSLERLGNKWSDAYDSMKKYFNAFLANQALANEKQEQDLRNLQEIGGKLPIAMPKLPAPPGGRERGLLPPVDPKLISDLRIAGETLDQQVVSTERAAKANTAYAKSIENTTKPINDWVALMYSGILQMRHTIPLVEDLTDTLDNFRGRFKGADMFPEPPEGTLAKWTAFGKEGPIKAIQETMPVMMKFGNQMRDFLAKDFGALVVQGITGGGDVVKGALTGLGNKLFAPDGAFGESIQKNLGDLFGSKGLMGKIGSTLSGMVPMIGSFIGPAIDGITALGKKLFGKSEESAKVSPLRDEFFKLQGGLDALNPKVIALGGNLGMVKAVLDAKTVQEYNAAIANMNDLFKVQEDAVLALTEAADRYGFTLEELGPALQAQQLDEQAQQLYKDWQILNAAGIDTTLIAGKMSESINAYIHDAARMGVEVPEAMRPMLQKMVEMGQLTDGSGNKIDSLEQAGVTFTMTMSQGFQELIKEVKNLAEILSTGLGRAVDETSAKIGRIPRKVTVETEYRETGNRPGGGQSVPGYQTGTDGKFVDFGTGTLAMLHGKEAIIPENATIAGGASAAGGAAVAVTIDARGALFGGPGDDQRLAVLVERALTAKYGLQHSVRAA